MLLSYSTGRAQPGWQIVFTTPGPLNTPIGSGFFFDENRGLVGTGIRSVSNSLGQIYPGDPIHIYMTSDGGRTWQVASTPLLYGAVTQIFMTDLLHGYASIFSDGTLGFPELWRTSDGGSTWVQDIPLVGIGTCVYVTSKAIIYTDWYDRVYSGFHTWGGGYSMDGGQSWSTQFSPHGNGIDFVNDSVGVVTQQNIVPSNFWRTTDGGITWAPTSSNCMEAWSVYGVKGTNMFFTANESQPGEPNQDINCSTDAGATWRLRYAFPQSTSVSFTGAIEGKGSTLYVQADDDGDFGTLSYYGLYRSDDLGFSWMPVGGPTTGRDTRFVVTGCSGQVVYAFDDQGNIWKTTGGGDGTLLEGNPNDAVLALDRDTLRIRTRNCSDSGSFGITSLACTYLHFDSVQVESSGDLSVGGLQTDQILHQGDSLFGTVKFTPQDTGHKIENLLVFCHAGSRVYTRVLVVDLQSDIPEALSLSKDTVNFVSVNCAAASDSIRLAINSCSQLVIDSVSMSDSAFLLATTLPTSGLSTDQVLTILYAPDTTFSHRGNMRIHGHCGTHVIDTSLALTGLTSIPSPVLATSADTLNFRTTYCAQVSDSLIVSNPNCTAIILDSVVSQVPFFVRAFSNGQTVAAGGTYTLPLAFAPLDSGSAAGTVTIFAHSIGGKVVTITQLLGYNMRGAQSILLSKDSVSLVTSSCSRVIDSLVLANQGCADVTIDSIVSSSGEVSANTPNIKSLRGGDSSVVRFTFLPDSGGVHLDVIHLYCHIGLAPFDTTISCRSESVVPLDPLSFSTDSLLSIDSINLLTSYCQATTLGLRLHNATCNPMELDSLRFINDSLHEFGYDTAGVTPIRSLDSTSLNITFSPIERGKRSASMRFFLHYGNHFIDTTLAITGKNATSPEPYLAPLPSGKAGDTLSIAVMLLPTIDSFSIKHIRFHLTFNTDLITPDTTWRTGTLSQGAKNVAVNPEPGIGASFSEDLSTPITQHSDLTLPLVILRAPIYLSRSISTPISLDRFAIDTIAIEPLCSIPMQIFTATMACGDSTIRTLMLGNPLSLRINSIHPNPAAVNSSVEISYSVVSAADAPELDIIDATGRIVRTLTACPASEGQHTLALPLPEASGEYQIVLKNSRSQDSKKFLIEK